MPSLIDATVFIVDDDQGVREALAWLLRSRRLSSESFPNAEAFVDMLPTIGKAHRPCCLLLDVRMPGMSGLALFEQLIAQGLQNTMPVIFLTGHADVPTAVDAVKRGAFDFCEKPFSDNALVDRVEQALAASANTLAQMDQQLRLRTLLAELTERERDVMQCVLEGLPNKLIADQLAISVRTVEVHRSRVFEKMSVKSAVELANLLRALAPGPAASAHVQR
jgi:two-component system response regulator DctR